MRIIGNLFQNNANFIPKVFGGIDTKNILAEETYVSNTPKTMTYTATEDCVVTFNSQVQNIYIDDIELTKDATYSTGGCRMTLLKKGQTLKFTSNVYNYKAFGIKY